MLGQFLDLLHVGGLLIELGHFFLILLLGQASIFEGFIELLFLFFLAGHFFKLFGHFAKLLLQLFLFLVCQFAVLSLFSK